MVKIRIVIVSPWKGVDVGHRSFIGLRHRQSHHRLHPTFGASLSAIARASAVRQHILGHRHCCCRVVENSASSSCHPGRASMSAIARLSAVRLRHLRHRLHPTFGASVSAIARISAVRHHILVIVVHHAHQASTVMWTGRVGCRCGRSSPVRRGMPRCDSRPRRAFSAVLGGLLLGMACTVGAGLGSVDCRPC